MPHPPPATEQPQQPDEPVDARVPLQDAEPAAEDDLQRRAAGGGAIPRVEHEEQPRHGAVAISVQLQGGINDLNHWLALKKCSLA